MTVSQIWAAGDRLTLGLEDVLGGVDVSASLVSSQVKRRRVEEGQGVGLLVSDAWTQDLLWGL